MAIRLMSLRGVPDGELDDICSLFDERTISYHLTAPSNWHISAGAIWLDDSSQLEQAYALLNDYQQQRRQQAQQALTESLENGEQAGLFDRIIKNPMRFIGFLIVLGFVLYISLVPFIDFGR